MPRPAPSTTGACHVQRALSPPCARVQVCMARSLAYDLASAQEQAEVSRSAAPYAHPRGT
eukprot:86875-Chlamydomonas_euryale.AAC.4